MTLKADEYSLANGTLFLTHLFPAQLRLNSSPLWSHGVYAVTVLYPLEISKFNGAVFWLGYLAVYKV